jgi:hypothetical protein
MINLSDLRAEQPLELSVDFVEDLNYITGLETVTTELEIKVGEIPYIFKYENLNNIAKPNFVINKAKAQKFQITSTIEANKSIVNPDTHLILDVENIATVKTEFTNNKSLTNLVLIDSDLNILQGYDGNMVGCPVTFNIQGFYVKNGYLNSPVPSQLPALSSYNITLNEKDNGVITITNYSKDYSYKLIKESTIYDTNIDELGNINFNHNGEDFDTTKVENITLQARLKNSNLLWSNIVNIQVNYIAETERLAGYIEDLTTSVYSYLPDSILGLNEGYAYQKVVNLEIIDTDINYLYIKDHIDLNKPVYTNIGVIEGLSAATHETDEIFKTVNLPTIEQADLISSAEATYVAYGLLCSGYTTSSTKYTKSIFENENIKFTSHAFEKDKVLKLLNKNNTESITAQIDLESCCTVPDNKLMFELKQPISVTHIKINIDTNIQFNDYLYVIISHKDENNQWITNRGVPYRPIEDFIKSEMYDGTEIVGGNGLLKLTNPILNSKSITIEFIGFCKKTEYENISIQSIEFLESVNQYTKINNTVGVGIEKAVTTVNNNKPILDYAIQDTSNTSDNYITLPYMYDSILDDKIRFKTEATRYKGLNLTIDFKNIDEIKIPIIAED